MYFPVSGRDQIFICLNSECVCECECVCVSVCACVCVCLCTLLRRCFHTTGLLPVVSNSESSRLASTSPSWLAVTDSSDVHVYKLFAECCLVLPDLWHVPAANTSPRGRQSGARGGGGEGERAACTVRLGVRLPLGGRHGNLGDMKDAGPCSVSRLLEISTTLSAFVQHISRRFSVKCLLGMSVLKV